MLRILRRRSVKGPEDARWQVVRAYEARLQGRWGLGRDQQGAAYRDRLRRLCDFLGELEPVPGNARENELDFDKLQRGIARTPLDPAAREAYLYRLEDLRQALRVLERDVRTVKRWEAWAPAGGPPTPERQARLRKALTALGALPSGRARWHETAEGSLQALWNLLEGLKAGAQTRGARARVKNARTRWREYVHDLAGDYEWAHAQILIRLARECLQEKAFSPTCCQRAKTAKEALESAIPRLERMGLNQSWTQGLYGLLAETCLTLGKAGDTPPEERQRQIESALLYARHAVANAPASIRERLVLIDVLSTLGDPEDIKVQAEIALDLDSGPETLRTIGGSYWGRTAALRGKGARRRLLREAAEFFVRALENVESAPLDEQCPLDQVQAHGWAHFWLGRFKSEVGRFAEAAAHLAAASTLGFKPLEAQVELAWTCLFARDRKRADQAFRKAVEEAGRQLAARARIDPHAVPCRVLLTLIRQWLQAPVVEEPDEQGRPRRTTFAEAAGDELPVVEVAFVAEAAGEERPIVELVFEAFLGWAFLCADWDTDRALDYARIAETLLGSSSRPNERELQGALLEVRGRVALRKRNFRESIKLLEESVRLSPGSGAYCALGLANLRPARAAGAGTPAALQRACAAYRLGRDCDVRGRYRRELWELRRELRKLEELRKQEKQRAAPTSPPSPTTPPPSPTTPPPSQPKP
jgi:tetratricopeptide (TPR) repeat protein